MGFLISLLIIGFIIVIILGIKAANKEQSIYYYDDSVDDFYENDSFNTSHNDSSSFAYPDPYDLPPDKSMYLNEDGELLDDL